MSPDTQQILQSYQLFGAEILSRKEMIAFLQACDDAYFNDEDPLISDQEYDAVKRVAQQTHPKDPYFLGVGSEVRGGKVKLPFTMGSLNQKYEGETIEWVRKNQLMAAPHVITDKLDGTSAMVVYGESGTIQIAYSKGDGFEGADITRHIRKFDSIPATASAGITVRGEVILSESSFNLLRTKVKTRAGQPYKNRRNMVAGLMNAGANDPIVYQHLRFIAYDIRGNQSSKSEQLKWLTDMHFETPGSVTVKGQQLDDQFLTAHLNDRRAQSVYELDGLVVEVDDAGHRRSLIKSADTLNPEYAIKYKIAEASNLKVTTVVAVEWNLSKDGYYKPRVQVEPVDLVGVTIQHATGFNAKFIAEHGIGPGAKVAITRAGDVVPFIIEVIEPMPI